MRADSQTYARRYRAIHNDLARYPKGMTPTDQALDAVQAYRDIKDLAGRLIEGDADLGDERDCLVVLSRHRCPEWPIEDDVLAAAIDEARAMRGVA